MIGKGGFMEDVVILGGGASALMCAVANAGKSKITIIEKNDKFGKKILATGNGRCNLTNINLCVDKYNDGEVQKFFDRFGVQDTLKMFGNLGLETYYDDEGRVYPISNSSNSVLDVLRLKISSMNINIVCNFDLVKIKKLVNGFELLDSNNQKIIAKKLVVATGGNTDSQILHDLNVDFKPYKRSLGALKSDKNKGLNGVKVQGVKVCLEVNNKQKIDFGEILFKEDAVSGIVVFNLSTLMARENSKSGKLAIDFLPNITVDMLSKRLIKQREILKDCKVEDFLTGIFHKALNINLLTKCGIDLNKPVSKLVDKEINCLSYLIKNYNLNVYEVCDNNQVYSGGVVLSDLNANLQHKLDNNLYFIGEAVDVDGECGGYNLQWAWTSGYIVGDNL